MKRITLLFAFCFLAVAAVLAQPKLVFGAQVGANFTKPVFSKDYNSIYLSQLNYMNLLNAEDNEIETDVEKHFASSQTVFKGLRDRGLHGGLKVGFQFGSNFWLMVEPTFVQMRANYKTSQPLREPKEFVEIGGAIYTEYYDRAVRSFEQNFTTIKVPVMSQFKVFGDRFGLTAGVGLAGNWFLKGKFSTAATTKTSGTLPRVPQVIDVAKGDYVNNPEYPDNGKFAFGATDFEQGDYKKSYLSFELNPGLFYNIDEGGRIKITLDWRLSSGLGNLVSEARQDELNSSYSRFLPDQNRVQGTQKLSSSVLSIGVVICPTCEF